MPRPVVIVDYDPQWPARFEEERALIRSAIGPHVVAIEHVGSTAVVGLGAKPVIDIIVGIRSLADAAHCIGPLAAVGYTYYPDHEAEMPERRYFDVQAGPRDAHLHMVEYGGAFWQRHLAFRDYLRSHPEAMREYDRLKRELAAHYGSDREGYTNAKTDFVKGIEHLALEGATTAESRAGERPTADGQRVIVLAMHGSPPLDFPRAELSEFFALHGRLGSGRPIEAESMARYAALEAKMRAWPRTAGNDPFWRASMQLVEALARAAGTAVLAGFVEFCAPSVDEALDSAAALRPERIVVLTPMMTQGGEHAEKDIPAALDRARGRHPAVTIEYAWPFAVEAVAAFLAQQALSCGRGRR
jgi:sirohydrochlorin cobaltochelatase